MERTVGRTMERRLESADAPSHHPTGKPGELGLIGLTNAQGALVCEPFDPNDQRHIALMEVFANGCPECRAILQGLRSPEPGESTVQAPPAVD